MSSSPVGHKSSGCFRKQDWCRLHMVDSRNRVCVSLYESARFIHNVSANSFKFIWSIIGLVLPNRRGDRCGSDGVLHRHVITFYSNAQTNLEYNAWWVHTFSRANVITFMMKTQICSFVLPALDTNRWRFLVLRFSFERTNYWLRLPETAEGHSQTSRWSGEVAQG